MIVKKKGKKIVASSREIKAANRKYIKAAEGDQDDFMDDFDDEEADGIMDAMDTIADNVEDLQDSIDDVDEDDVEIAMNNNIGDHYIAECDKCNGIFISAVVESDQIIDHVSGTCPLCGKDSDQYLKWIIKDVNEGV